MYGDKIKASGEGLILLSGGIDSTACLVFYRNLLESVSALFIDYGQSAANNERASAITVCEHYKTPLRIINVAGLGPWPSGYINGRNAFLLHSALMASEFDKGIIAIGVHSSTSYSDCSEYFIGQMQASFDIYTDGRVRINAPFINWSKGEIVEYCRMNEVPLELTYSCELGGAEPCHQCASCIDTEVLINAG
jgi:7-cyano-7-deazaguanine synthase